MTKSITTSLKLFGLIIIILAASIAAYIVVKKDSPKDISKDPKADIAQRQDELIKSTQGLKKYEDGLVFLTACDLLDEPTAKAIIGKGKITKNKSPIEARVEVETSKCEYSGKARSVAVTVYRYQKDADAAASKYKDSSKTSLASVKGKFVINVSVKDNEKFNAEQSAKLLEQALGKL